MSDSNPTAGHPAPSPDEMNSALFAYLVMQQSNMATMLLGKTPHPQTGKTMRDLDSAKLFIDQLEMLEVKTKGNLSPEEGSLLKQTLMNLRLAFVEAADAPEATEPKQAAPEPTQPAPEAAKSVPEAPAAEDEEHRKKFSKKY